MVLFAAFRDKTLSRASCISSAATVKKLANLGSTSSRLKNPIISVQKIGPRQAVNITDSDELTDETIRDTGGFSEAQRFHNAIAKLFAIISFSETFTVLVL